MGPDPFNLPGWGSTNNTQELNQATSQLAPYATTWHGPAGGVAIPQVVNQPSKAPRGGALSRFAHFMGGIGTDIGHIAGGAATWLAHNAVDMVEAPYKYGEGLAHGLQDRTSISEINAQNQQFSSKLDTLNRQFKSGDISSKVYQQALKELNQDMANLSRQATVLDNRTQKDQQAANLATINTISDVLVFGAPALSDGMSAAKSFVLSKALTPVVESAENNLGRIAANKALFDGLSDGAKQALQQSTAEVVSNAGRDTAANITRKAAVNLAIKYPIYYNYLSSTGADIYNELDNKKYGDAMRTVGFNALLLLSGGPIGQALKYGGKTVGGIANRTFARTSFLDALSRGIGNGDPAGLFNAINKLPESERADVVKQMSAVEATNLGAVGGNDAEAAAMRVIQGMESYEGISMTDFSHEEALNNMVSFARAQRLADETAKAAGMGPVTVGRVDARALNQIAESLVNTTSSEDRLTTWEALKKTGGNQAWANNENFDRQMKSLISRYDDPTELAEAISKIKAGFEVRGFPKSVAEKLSKMGYIPISPGNIEAPFAEGSGKIASKFGGNDDFFTKAVQPLPILGGLGKALNFLGLSPYASTQRVYQLFNDNLAKNLQESGTVRKIMGEDISDSTDTLIKKLSDYAHNPTRGKIVSKMPITDLRMLTLGDIKAALEVSTSEARSIQKAIAQSYIQVPLSVRGLGDRAVDATYRIGATGAVQRRYLRVLGAARFSWNPFFQYLRVIPKTEILSSFEGGGFVNSVFAGRLGELGKIRQGLRSAGMLDERAGFTTTGEAVDFGGATGANISKRLLPMQERSIAGLVDAQARRMGMNWQDYVKNYPQQVRDTVQMIAEYDKRSNLLNSPLMRTLNIAFFPMRFDTKVATIMARGLARSSLMTQVSVINGMMRAHDFLNSPEGQAWYAQNSDIIGLFNYVTPVAKLSEVFESLLPGHDHSLGNFGELGGLPFGWIPQILDAEGLTHFNQPGVDAKTGAIIPQYIPATQRGQLAVATQDLLTQLFSYPGATVGLQSKASITRFAGLALVGGNKKTDLQLTTPSESQLGRQQQDYSSLIQSLSSTPAQHPAPLPTAPLRPGINVPSQAGPTLTNKGPASASSTRTKKKKKADFKPQLLPGQTTFGQL